MLQQQPDGNWIHVADDGPERLYGRTGPLLSDFVETVTHRMHPRQGEPSGGGGVWYRPGEVPTPEPGPEPGPVTFADAWEAWRQACADLIRFALPGRQLPPAPRPEDYQA